MLGPSNPGLVLLLLALIETMSSACALIDPPPACSLIGPRVCLRVSLFVLSQVELISEVLASDDEYQSRRRLSERSGGSKATRAQKLITGARAMVGGRDS